MPPSIRKTKFQPKLAKLHGEVDGIRLCLSSLERSATEEGYGLAASYLKIAQFFLAKQFCEKQIGSN